MFHRKTVLDCVSDNIETENNSEGLHLRSQYYPNGIRHSPSKLRSFYWTIKIIKAQLAALNLQFKTYKMLRQTLSLEWVKRRGRSRLQPNKCIYNKIVLMVIFSLPFINPHQWSVTVITNQQWSDLIGLLSSLLL